MGNFFTNAWDSLTGFLEDPLGVNSSKKSIKLQEKSIDESSAIQREAIQAQKDIAEKNLGFQRDAYDYQRQLNDLNMEREDNAVQRRVADLEAAGLSPTLAAGSAASAAPVRAGTAPQASDTWAGTMAQYGQNRGAMRMAMAEHMREAKVSQIGILSGLMSNFADISKTMAETQFLKANMPNIIDKTKAEAEGQKIANEFSSKLNEAKIRQIFADISVKEQDIIDRRLENVLREDAHMLNTYRAIRAGLENTYLSNQISEKEIDILAKTLSYNYYSSLGAPEGAFSGVGKDAGYIAKQFSDALRFTGNMSVEGASKIGSGIKKLWNKIIHTKTGGAFDYTE